MAYQVKDGVELARTLAKGVPFTNVSMSICDITSSTIYRSFAWRDTLKVFTPVALVDSTQDLATGLTDIFRMTQFWTTRTDVTPNQVRNITVAKNLFIDLIPKSPTQIRSASYQAGVNKFRLETSVRIPVGSTWTLGGEYQPQHTKLTDISDSLWFTDQFLEVYAKGLIYWAYRLADDSKAGAAVKVGNGRVQYSGALAEFMNAIEEMAAQEDFGNLDGYYPSDSLGSVDARRTEINELLLYLVS